MSAPKIIALTSKIFSPCLSCEDVIRVGDKIWWTPGVGAWHAQCPKPRSLQMLWNEAQKKREIGL